MSGLHPWGDLINVALASCLCLCLIDEIMVQDYCWIYYDVLSLHIFTSLLY
jgi:hypothetical protein